MSKATDTLWRHAEQHHLLSKHRQNCLDVCDEADFIGADGWIAVADRLPDKAGEYLAAYRNSSGRWSMILDTFDEMAKQKQPGQRVWFSNRVPTEPMPIQYWHELPPFQHGELSA